MPKPRKRGAGSPEAHRFPPERAFVIKLPDADLGRRPNRGRVEHVLSGRTGRFESLDQLAEFFAAVLEAEGAADQDEEQ